MFLKDKNFSRTEYEKFLIKSGVTAPQFEANIVEQEKRRQFLSSLSGGLVIPEILVIKEYRKENQTKIIKFIDLNKIYSNYKPSKKVKKKFMKGIKIFFLQNSKQSVMPKLQNKLVEAKNIMKLSLSNSILLKIIF